MQERSLLKKPKNFDEYLEWINQKFHEESIYNTKLYYESVTEKIKSDIVKSSFWNKFQKNISMFNQEFLVKTGYDLCLKTPQEIFIKPFDSFLMKTYRMNVLGNKNWPNEPNHGWITSENWFRDIKDIVRTLIIVKYLDGVDFLLAKIKDICKENNQECLVSYEAKEEGYYAVHINIKHEVEIPNYDWDTQKIEVYLEIQITTQLQEVIRKLLHKYYEKNREREIVSDTWQWKYGSEEFFANYLGHILHYLEGMIMEVRKKQGEVKNEKRIP